MTVPDRFTLLLRGLLGFILTIGGLSNPRTLNALPQRTFVHWCRAQDRLTPGQRRTIDAMLESVETQDCEQAELRLLQRPYLQLINQQLTDLTPLSSLTHLETLDLSLNQITDLSPLQHFERLRFVHLQRNQIRSVHALANHKQLVLLNLLDNPVTAKVCPVKPTACLFSDGATSLYERAESDARAGQFQAALSAFEQALAIYQRNQNLHRQGDTLNRLADMHLKLGQYSQALLKTQQALQLQRRIEDAPGVGVSLTSLASVYTRLGQYAKAQQQVESAIANLQSQNPFRLDGAGPYQHAEEEGRLYHRLARLQIQQGNATAALSSLAEATTRYQNLPPGYERRTLGIHLITEAKGVAHLRQGNAAAALTALNTARTIAAEHKLSGLGSTLHYLGEFYFEQGEMQQATAYFRQALKHARNSSDQDGMGLALHHLGLIELQNQEYPQASATLRQAIAVWEALRPGLEDDQKVALFETQAETYQQLQVALIAQGKPERALEVAERGRARAFLELLASRVDPLTSTPPPMTIEQMRAVARAQKATLVEYSLLEDRLLIWVITPDGQVHHRTVAVARSTLLELIQATRQTIGVSDRGSIRVARALASGSDQQNPLRQLHRRLIEPISELLPTDPNQRVAFIPHRELFLVPFPTLQGSDGPLITKHTLFSTPSIQLLAFTQSLAQTQDSPALVVGNPVMPSIPVGKGQQPLMPLPGAEREAVAIASLLQTQALTGATATEATVVERMTTAQTIHLATHGLLEELSLETPGAIALTSTSNTDGFLTTDEILNLTLQANLVVLSACNTGMGKITGDGVVGLSRAFMAAGVPSVVVSLWSVPDAPTAELMIEFYRQQQRGLDKAQALRQAMLLTRERHPHPKDWAAFTLLGAT